MLDGKFADCIRDAKSSVRFVKRETNFDLMKSKTS